ncbi:MAG: hypothetical protein DRJ14_08595 [Acidobacteria bacterium]|nr:MAG: hypothetical protein DRJ14_08595 [Acidobacteriota bacterium]
MKKNIFFILIASTFLFSFRVMADVYYLPHIHATSDVWETYLVVDPVLSGGSYYKLTLYDDSGNVTTTQTGTINNNSELRVSLRPLGGTCGMFVTKGYPVRVRLAYVAKDSSGGGTAEFPLETELSRQSLFTLSNYYDKLTWSGFALFNGSDRDVSIEAKGMKDGGVVVTKSFDLGAHSKVVDYFDHFFGLNSFTDIDSVVFSTDYPALTGIVISGKDNDKLLFSASRNTTPDQSINNEEYFNGFIYPIGLARLSPDEYFTLNFHDGSEYLRKIFGQSFDEFDLGTHLWGEDLVASSDGENLLVFGTDDTGKFVVRKISPSGETLWQTEVGDVDTNSSDLDDGNIVGQAINGSVITAFHDNSNQGVIRVLDESTGAVTDTETGLPSNAKFYSAFLYNGKVGLAFVYESGSKYLLEFLFVDKNGNQVKQIVGNSPASPDCENVIFTAFGSGDYVYACFGAAVSDGSGILFRDFSVYAMAVPYSSTNFANPSIVYLPDLYLSKGSKIFSGFSQSFSTDADESWVIFTSPQYVSQLSSKYIIEIKNQLPQSIYKSQDLPYRILGVYDVMGMFLIEAEQLQQLDGSTFRTKLIEKTLIGDNLLNY